MEELILPGVGGGTKPSPEQIAGFKEAGLRERFTVDIGAAIGPYIMGSVLSEHATPDRLTE
jgi:hypothetical protein